MALRNIKNLFDRFFSRDPGPPPFITTLRTNEDVFQGICIGGPLAGKFEVSRAPVLEAHEQMLIADFEFDRGIEEMTMPIHTYRFFPKFFVVGNHPYSVWVHESLLASKQEKTIVNIMDALFEGYSGWHLVGKK